MKPIISEDINKIKRLMGLLTESSVNNLPSGVKDSIEKLKSTPFNLKINDSHIKKELEFGNVYDDAGGENPIARKKIEGLISSAKNIFGNRIPVNPIISGYRSYNTQVNNFGNKAKVLGVDKVQSSNSLPGFSQHHTGLCFDIFSVDPSWWEKNSDIKKWVEENSSTFGFKVTYTGQNSLRIPEPWHLFYLG